MVLIPLLCIKKTQKNLFKNIWKNLDANVCGSFICNWPNSVKCPSKGEDINKMVDPSAHSAPKRKWWSDRYAEDGKSPPIITFNTKCGVLREHDVSMADSVWFHLSNILEKNKLWIQNTLVFFSGQEAELCAQAGQNFLEEWWKLSVSWLFCCLQ